jgi:XRE family transcriptional regulator, regulator of sulfur utilization
MASDNTKLDRRADLNGVALGERLRQVRQERGLSLKEVAAGSNMSASFLSLVETGKSDLSLNRLLAVLRYYGIGLIELLPEERPQDLVVVHPETRPHVSFPGEGFDVYLLTPDTKRTFAPMIAVIQPSAEPAEFSQHPGQEFLLVLEGEISFAMHGSAPRAMSEGDSIYYDSGRQHIVQNMSKDDPAVVLFVSCPPTL